MNNRGYFWLSESSAIFQGHKDRVRKRKGIQQFLDAMDSWFFSDFSVFPGLGEFQKPMPEILWPDAWNARYLFFFHFTITKSKAITPLSHPNHHRNAKGRSQQQAEGVNRPNPSKMERTTWKHKLQKHPRFRLRRISPVVENWIYHLGTHPPTARGSHPGTASPGNPPPRGFQGRESGQD